MAALAYLYGTDVAHCKRVLASYNLAVPPGRVVAAEAFELAAGKHTYAGIEAGT